MYILFGGADYYPDGGANDILDFFDNSDSAALAGMSASVDWWHVYDVKAEEICESGRNT